MALYPDRRELDEHEIAFLIARIEREEDATNIQYVGPTVASYVFTGIVENREIKFCVDNESFFIITEEI